MPTDTLVDVEVTVKLINVRKSQVEYANQLLRSLFHYEDLLYLQDKKTGSSPWDLNLTKFSEPRIIEDMLALCQAPARIPMPHMTPSEKPEDKSGGISMPADKLSKKFKSPRNEEKKYPRMSDDYDELAITFIGEHDGCCFNDIARALNFKPKAQYPRLERLIKQNKIIKIKVGAGRMGAVKYHVPKPVSPSMNAPVNKELVKELEAAKPILKPVDKEAPERETVVSQEMKAEWSGLRSGNDKDKDIKAAILAFLKKTPAGAIKTEIDHEIAGVPSRTRKLLVELEEDHKITVGKIPGEFGVKTCYYLKETAVPAS